MLFKHFCLIGCCFVSIHFAVFSSWPHLSSSSLLVVIQLMCAQCWQRKLSMDNDGSYRLSVRESRIAYLLISDILCALNLCPWVLDNFWGLCGPRTRTRGPMTRTRTCKLILEDFQGQGLSSRTTTLTRNKVVGSLNCGKWELQSPVVKSDFLKLTDLHTEIWQCMMVNMFMSLSCHVTCRHCVMILAL